jgi:glycosyltransferase involved in cell wall biosynthesis
MKICLVTTFPPSTGGLSEYGYHIAQELQRNPFLNLTVLADKISPGQAEIDGFSVLRCWSFDDPGSVIRLMIALQRLKPDVVWFNLLFSTFGRRPLVAFSGLMSPLLARLSGRYTHVTLHHLMDTVDLKDIGVRHEWLYRSAGAVATRMLLLSNSVSVLMPSYRKILNDKYGRDNVHLRTHGILARRPEFPDFVRRGNPVNRILAFGKWGTYKRLELMIAAFRLIAAKVPRVKLVIAGGDHPQAAGYTESVRRRCAGDPDIEFLGYVPEDALPDLFQTSTVAVMPYSSSTGCSGVAHLACAYGVPIVSADLTDFRQMAQDEELAIEFYLPGDVQGLADCLVQLLQNPDKQRAMAAQNFSAGLRMTMPNVVQKYLRHFELHQRTQALKYVSRFRRLPDWVPSKLLMLRYLTRNSLSWRRRSAILHSSPNDRDSFGLANGDGNGRGSLNRGGTAVNGDDIAARSDAALDRSTGFPAAGHAAEDHDGQGRRSQKRDGSPAQASANQASANKDNPEQSRIQQPNGENGTPSPRLLVPGSDGNVRNSEHGTHGRGSGSNGSGSERIGQSVRQTGTG